MGYAVKTSSYQTCICGRECKGRAAFANHARKCDTERVRSALAVFCACESLPPVSDAALMRRFDDYRTALTARGAL
jgi:hypothetical protein